MLRNTLHPGEFLKEELEERELSQSELAHHIGVEPGVINVICKGRTVEVGKLLKLLVPRARLELARSFRTSGF